MNGLYYLRPGDRVRVNTGPWEGREGTVVQQVTSLDPKNGLAAYNVKVEPEGWEIHFQRREMGQLATREMLAMQATIPTSTRVRIAKVDPNGDRAHLKGMSGTVVDHLPSYVGGPPVHVVQIDADPGQRRNFHAEQLAVIDESLAPPKKRYGFPMPRDITMVGDTVEYRGQSYTLSGSVIGVSVTVDARTTKGAK